MCALGSGLSDCENCCTWRPLVSPVWFPVCFRALLLVAHICRGAHFFALKTTAAGSIPVPVVWSDLIT